MTFKRVADQSGLEASELAKLYGVTRQAIHYWRTKAGPREGTLAWRSHVVITEALLGAMQKGILPLGDMKRDARKARIARMAITLQNLKLAPVKE